MTPARQRRFCSCASSDAACAGAPGEWLREVRAHHPHQALVIFLAEDHLWRNLHQALDERGLGLAELLFEARIFLFTFLGRAARDLQLRAEPLHVPGLPGKCGYFSAGRFETLSKLPFGFL